MRLARNISEMTPEDFSQVVLMHLKQPPQQLQQFALTHARKLLNPNLTNKISLAARDRLKAKQMLEQAARDFEKKEQET